jgi:hypothetical protein
MTEANPNILIQISKNDLKQLIQEAVKEEMSKINDAIRLNPKESESKSDLLTRKETAELLSVSETTLFLWNRDKVLEHKKLNNRVYYLRSNVMNKLNSVA